MYVTTIIQCIDVYTFSSGTPDGRGFCEDDAIGEPPSINRCIPQPKQFEMNLHFECVACGNAKNNPTDVVF